MRDCVAVATRLHNFGAAELRTAKFLRDCREDYKEAEATNQG